MTRDEGNPSGRVPLTATHPEDIRARWAWAEPCVWTDRMLEALETGVKGGKWHALIDKVWRPENLLSAWRQVARKKGGPGADGVTVGAYGRREAQNLRDLHDSLKAGTYRPGPILRKHIPKPGRPGETRPLGIPGVRDRVVQAAVRNVIEPIFERTFAEHSYGFRPHRGAKDALRRVDALLQGGFTHVVDADLKAYFDTIPHEGLMVALREQIADRTVLGLIEAFLRQPISDDGALTVPERGTPQGAVISPLLANAYLTPLDHLMAREGFEMVRYADDFVVLCTDAASAERALALIRRWTEQSGLTLHPEKTRLVDMEAEEYFDFLGYRFFRSGDRIRHRAAPKSVERIRSTIREVTPRNSGRSMLVVIQDLNKILRGWFQYFKQGLKTTLSEVDRFVRTRLRALLWRRSKGRGFPSRHTNYRWPNTHFARLGLVSTLELRERAIQSARAANL